VEAKRTLLHSFATPLTTIASKRDLMICTEMANSAWGLDLSSWVSVQNHAKELHDALEVFLNSEKTFFTKLSSFDLVVYAYLKEEMINTKRSEVVDYLNNNCPNLLVFVKHLD
jgi:hypothetical protein